MAGDRRPDLLGLVDVDLVINDDEESRRDHLRQRPEGFGELPGLAGICFVDRCQRPEPPGPKGRQLKVHKPRQLAAQEGQEDLGKAPAHGPRLHARQDRGKHRRHPMGQCLNLDRGRGAQRARLAHRVDRPAGFNRRPAGIDRALQNHLGVGRDGQIDPPRGNQFARAAFQISGQGKDVGRGVQRAAGDEQVERIAAEDNRHRHRLAAPPVLGENPGRLLIRRPAGGQLSPTGDAKVVAAHVQAILAGRPGDQARGADPGRFPLDEQGWGGQPGQVHVAAEADNLLARTASDHAGV